MKTVIIGGGIGGLATAWYVQQFDPLAEIVICEASPRWGGLIASSQLDGNHIERGPDAILSVKPAGLRLIHELGLADDIVTTNPAARQAYIARGQRLVPIPAGLDLVAPARIWPFLCSSIVGWGTKLRMACDVILPRRKTSGDESLASFVRRRMGQGALRHIVQPLVGAIHSVDPEDLSVEAVFPRFHQLETTHRSLIRGLRASAPQSGVSGPRYGLFISLRGGLERLVTTLVSRLAPRQDLRLQCPVYTLARTNSGWQVDTAQGSITADTVVLALPAPRAAALMAAIDPGMSAALAAIPYHGVATVNVICKQAALARLPPGAGMVVPRHEQRTLFACSFASQKFAERNKPGHVIVRAAVGGGLDATRLTFSDEAIIAGVHHDLGELIGLTGTPIATVVSRWPASLPHYRVGHVDFIRQLRRAEAQLPGLVLVGNAYEGTGIPDVIAGAEAAARRLTAGTLAAITAANTAASPASTAVSA